MKLGKRVYVFLVGHCNLSRRVSSKQMSLVAYPAAEDTHSSSMPETTSMLEPGRWHGTCRGREDASSYLFALSFSSSSIRFSTQFFLQKKRTDDYHLLLELSSRSFLGSSFWSDALAQRVSTLFQQNPLHSQK